MRLALLALVAHAAPPECPTLPIRAGVVEGGLPECDGVVVPTVYAERAAELAASEARLQAEAVTLRAEVEALRLELLAAELERDHWQEAAKRAPLDRPVVGVLAGVGLCAASGWAVGQAAR